MEVILQTNFKKILRFFILLIFIFSFLPLSANQHGRQSVIRGTVTDSNNDVLEYATVYIKGSSMGTVTDEKGNYFLRIIPGNHTLRVQLMGYTTSEQEVEIAPEERKVVNIQLKQEDFNLSDVEVVGKSMVQQVNESAYNVVAIDAKALHNSTADLASAMARVSGVKLRESGGLGSDMRFSLNGFSGKHIKFFMDGVPMEGMGSSFQINNIPINLADRIEIYKGVVPVGFGGDAIGGAVNIVTNQHGRTYADISYSYGSFNTHRTSINAGYTTNAGVMFELNAFQNYSDNTYKIQTPVEDLIGGSIVLDDYKTVKRFHDTYHNETIIAKVGLVNKSFADRLILGINLGKNYRDIQNGVKQEIVFGQKHNKATTIMPSLRYMKRGLFTEDLDVSLTANYNNNISHNIDTATYKYNWYGENIPQGTLGEQSYQNSKYKNKNWNTTFTTRYKLSEFHSFSLNNVLTSYDRNTTATPSDASVVATDTIPKASRKNILGVDYKFNYNRVWNLSVFGKHYMQYTKGPKNTASSSSTPIYELFEERFTAVGYGVAATYFWRDFQVKLSYEKAYRLPTDNELFGDEDLEEGSVDLKAEKSNNYNLGISYSKDIKKTHFIYVDAGFMLRNTKDYIRRSVEARRSGRFVGAHINHGYVKNLGLNAEMRYGYKTILSLGLNITSQNIRDNEEYQQTSATSTTYKARIPNVPYFFTNGDIQLNWNHFLHNNNNLSLSYYNNYVRGFPRFSEKNGDPSTKMKIPKQFSHDISLTYAIAKGQYNISLECQNLTNEALYDNFSLQKPGRAFYMKFRYFFSK